MYTYISNSCITKNITIGQSIPPFIATITTPLKRCQHLGNRLETLLGILLGKAIINHPYGLYGEIGDGKHYCFTNINLLNQRG